MAELSTGQCIVGQHATCPHTITTAFSDITALCECACHHNMAAQR